MIDPANRVASEASRRHVVELLSTYELLVELVKRIKRAGGLEDASRPTLRIVLGAIVAELARRDRNSLSERRNRVSR
jgi:hypothetical protein